MWYYIGMDKLSTDIDTNTEKLPKRTEIAGRQVAVTEVLALLYREDSAYDAIVAGALDNPIAYATKENIDHLPKDLKTEWNEFSTLCAYFVVNLISETHTENWADPLQAIQKIIYDNESDCLARDAISELIVFASDLFEKSTKYKAGNTRLFEKNVEKIEKLLPSDM